MEPIPVRAENAGKQTLDAAFRVHTLLGPGLLESVYEKCLSFELHQRGVTHQTQLILPITYDEHLVEAGLRLDFLIDDSVVVELKAVESLVPLHQAQLMTYLKLSRKRLGLLINFNVAHLKNGIKRVVL